MQTVVVIPVVCAIIENNAKILCAQRSSSMSLALKWEFPGGKIEDYEDPEVALIREIEEELGIVVSIKKALNPSEYSYSPGKVVRLIPFICEVENAEQVVAKEHSQIRWLSKDKMSELDWAAADIPIVEEYIRLK